VGRDRHQNGWVEETGTRLRKWRGHWWSYERQPDGSERRVHHSVVLGTKSQMRKWEAAKALASIIERAAEPSIVRPSDAVTFAWFARERYLAIREQRWRPSTAAINRLVIDRHLIPRFGTMPLRDIGKFDIERFLIDAAGRYSASMVQKLRTYLGAILEEAVDQEFIRRNPARKVEMPRTRAVDRPFYTADEARRLLGELSGRNRIIGKIFLLCGLRPGEAFALRWRCFQGDRLEIRESVVRGAVGDTKTARSKGAVALPRALRWEIEAYREQCGHVLPEAWMFPSQTGRPIWKEDFLRDVLRPAAKAAGLARVNYQIFRRTFATIAHDLGFPLRVVQEQMRHASATTTGNVYAQAIPESVYRAVESVAEALQ